MSDDPSLTGRDRQFISTQPHERRSFIEAMQREFPDAQRAEIEDALDDALDQLAPSRDRTKITEFVRERLKR